MDLFFYAKEKKGAGKCVWELYQELAGEYHVEFFQTIESLSRRLRQPLVDYPIALLLAKNLRDLSDMLLINDLLDCIRIILILPNDKDETIRLGHILTPRFLTFKDSNFSWVREVLMGMCRKNMI